MTDKIDRRGFVNTVSVISGAALAAALIPRWALGARADNLREVVMEARIGKCLSCEYPRTFVPAGADLGDPAVVEKFYLELEKPSLDTPELLEAWLLQWSELSAVVSEEEAIRYIKMTCQTDDPEREAAFLHFVEKVSPRIKPLSDRLARKMLAAKGLAGLDPDRYFVLIRDLKNDVEIYRDANVPLQTAEEKLSQQYQKVTGGMTVQFDGQERTLQQMAPFYEVADRAVRQSAWETVARRRLQNADELNGIFDDMRKLRGRMARNAGFKNYRDFNLRLRGRFDYGVPESEAFHAAIEQAVVPLYRELQERRRARMKLDRLRPWDLRPDPFGRPPLHPFTTIDQLVAGLQKIFAQLDPELGRRFAFMVDHDLMDLESRKGKAPGAYSHSLGMLRLPFVFANSVGVDGDVNTMLHECGHAFHTMECRGEPLSFYRHAPLEFAEVASMSMEFLGLDGTAVFYGPQELARSREGHLESIIGLFCWIATVDAFQHWIYTHPKQTVAQREAAWVDLRRRFGGIEDWSEYEAERRSEWHRQLHIFEMPFYYIEYGIAQLGALQVWQKAEQDKAAALKAYRDALALGGSKPLPALFAAAGLKFDFSRATVEPLVRRVKDVLDKDAAAQGR